MSFGVRDLFNYGVVALVILTTGLRLRFVLWLDRRFDRSSLHEKMLREME